jgi:signal transduction histidine kinase
MTVANGTIVEMDRNSLLERLQQVPVFKTLKPEDMSCFSEAVVVVFQPGDLLVAQGTDGRVFWVVLEGELRVAQGQETVFGANETCGEVPLLAGTQHKVDLIANTPVRVVRLNEDGFWQMMTSCREVRQAILGNMARRLEMLQTLMVQREKLASLGTMAAGLMHELNNPGAAARRASSLLRENLMRLQKGVWELSRAALTEAQVDCLTTLHQRTLAAEKPKPRSSIEEADAEEAMADWLHGQGIAEAWQMAPTFVGIGITREELECARCQFSGEMLATALTWLESRVSSLQLVGTVEESISRVTELALAVKKYAYEGKIAQQAVNVNESIANTLIILAHKLRNKEIEVVKEFSPSLPPVTCYGAGLNQIWTNLLDNAIDALPQKGRIEIRTEMAGDQAVITVVDNGVGIPPEHQEHVFEPFYTTKAEGVGTGLGLDIVRRIVHDKLRGSVTFTSEPGKTVFTVRIPVAPQG